MCDDFLCSVPCIAETIPSIKLESSTSANGCQCFDGFAGPSCEKLACDKDCCADGGLQCATDSVTSNLMCLDATPSVVATSYLTRLAQLKKDNKISTSAVVRAMNRVAMEVGQIESLDKVTKSVKNANSTVSVDTANKILDVSSDKTNKNDAKASEDAKVSQASEANQGADKSTVVTAGKKAAKAKKDELHEAIEEQKYGQKVPLRFIKGHNENLFSEEEIDAMLNDPFAPKPPIDPDDSKVIEEFQWVTNTANSKHDFSEEHQKTVLGMLGVGNSFLEMASFLRTSADAAPAPGLDFVAGILDEHLSGQCCDAPSRCDGQVFNSLKGACKADSFYCHGSCNGLDANHKKVFARVQKANSMKTELTAKRQVSSICEGGVQNLDATSGSEMITASTICAKNTDNVWKNIPSSLLSLKAASESNSQQSEQLIRALGPYLLFPEGASIERTDLITRRGLAYPGGIPKLETTLEPCNGTKNTPRPLIPNIHEQQIHDANSVFFKKDIAGGDQRDSLTAMYVSFFQFCHHLIYRRLLYIQFLTNNKFVRRFRLDISS